MYNYKDKQVSTYHKIRLLIIFGDGEKRVATGMKP